MTRVGVDIEQFMDDPYGSGIQRVVQQLALNWPSDLGECLFILPEADAYRILSRTEAADLLSIPFKTDAGDAGQLRLRVAEFLGSRDVRTVGFAELRASVNRWLLPEVSYLPSVHQRVRAMREEMPVTMIGFDALPMTEPQNYRFRPGSSADVSEYFRQLATVDSVVCISDYARESILSVLRRSEALDTSVAHPGGDHDLGESTPVIASPDFEPKPGPTFLRVGTMEARKKPVELARAFELLALAGIDANLIMIGRPSASDERINAAVREVAAADCGVSWIQDAGDAEVHGWMGRADAFLSVGTEGYGIPVLESVRLGTPVLFGGIQPAAELLEGKGAARIADGDAEALAESLTRWAAASSRRSAGRRQGRYPQRSPSVGAAIVAPVHRDVSRSRCLLTMQS